MSDPDFFKGRTVTIAGLGLMGGSLALALRGRGAQIHAYDPSPDTVALANQIGIVNLASSNLEDVLPESDLVFLCAPVRAILNLLDMLPSILEGTALIMDIGSTKTAVCHAMDHLPERFEAVGGHPMCGAAAPGLAHARADLFVNAVFALTATRRTTVSARDQAEQIVHHLRARPFWIEAEIHDRWVAATSHSPYLIALGLTLATPEETAPLVGPGFRSTSRLAGSSVTMMLDTIMTNSGNVREALRHFRQNIDGIEKILVDEDEERLREMMDNGVKRLAVFEQAD